MALYHSLQNDARTVNCTVCRSVVWVLVVFCLVFSQISWADDGSLVPAALAVPEQAGNFTGNPADTPPDASSRLVLRNLGIVGGTALVFGVYGQVKWWDQGFTSNFRTVSEGWFSGHTYSGGTDKLGHMFTNYASTRLLTKAYKAVGNNTENSRWWAAGTSLGIFTGIELLDGFSRQWRFSTEDAVMNLVGTATGLLLESSPALDALFDIRLLYRPSGEDGQGFDPFGDYSGQTYLLVAKASGVSALRDSQLTRYIELSVGYQAKGFGSDDHSGRSRHIYLGAGLNLSELLDQALFSRMGRNRFGQRLTNGLLEYIQVPGTMLLQDNTLH